MSPTAHAALGYIRRGWPVVPLWWSLNAGTDTARCAACKAGADCGSPGKHPHGGLVHRGLHDASTDLSVVTGWWRRCPQANVGLLTGHHFDVVDVDGAEGLASLVAWERAGRPITWMGLVETGRGWHMYVPVTGRSNGAKLAPGIDFRGRGGYVVAPPSLHASGHRYAWCRDRNHRPQEAAA